jgi:hypothetical protein
MNYQNVFESINWEDVKGKILDTFDLRGIAVLDIKMNRDDQYGVEMNSNNIVNSLGIFQLALGDCRLKFFNKSLSLPELIEDDEAIFWATIQFSYPGNGMNIGTLWVQKNGEIIITKAAPRGIY